MQAIRGCTIGSEPSLRVVKELLGLIIQKTRLRFKILRFEVLD